MHCWLVRLGLFVWLLGVLCAPVSAQGLRLRSVLAQPQLSALDLEARNTTMARALFDEGLHFVDTEQWEYAQDRFARVLTLRYSAVAAYNLGLAEARLGRGVIAAASLRRLLTDPSLDAKVRERTTVLLSDIETHFAWLNLRVLGDCSGCTVYLGEQEWPWAVVGVSVPVDAGNYAARLRIGETIVAEEQLQIAPAMHLEATLWASQQALDSVRRAQAARSAGAHSAPAGPRPARRAAGGESLLSSGFFWGAMGVLVVGAAAAIVLETR
ncbi:MAG: hypothetical protein ABW321_33475 [Polyangiales bacterium]